MSASNPDDDGGFQSRSYKPQYVEGQVHPVLEERCSQEFVEVTESLAVLDAVGDEETQHAGSLSHEKTKSGLPFSTRRNRSEFSNSSRMPGGDMSNDAVGDRSFQSTNIVERVLELGGLHGRV